MNTPHDNSNNDSIGPEVGISPLPQISIQPNISVNGVELSSHDPMGVEKEQQLPDKPDPSNNEAGDKPQEDKSMDLTLPGIDDESFNKRKSLHETINLVVPSRPFSGVQSFVNTTRVVHDTPDLKAQEFQNKQGEFKSLNIDDEAEEEKQHTHGKPANNPTSHLNVEAKPEEVMAHNTSNNMVVVLPREENIGVEPAQGDAPLEDDFDAVPINLENIPQAEVKDIANTKAANYMVHEGIEKEKPAFDYLQEMKTRLRSWYRKDASGFSGFFCCFLYLIGMLVILSILFSFTFKYKELNLLSVSQPLQYLAENLNSDPIYKFKLISPGDTCPSDYELIVLGNWPGTEDGCLCSHNDLKYGSCDASDGGSYCDEISSIKSIDLYIWSEYAWCVQRAKLGTDYIKSVVCPDNFVQCSPGLCMQTTLDCPLTSFTMTDSNVNSDSIAYGSRYLTPYRESDKPPLIGLKATVNNLPCFNPSLAPTGAEPYLLINNPPQDCGRYGLDDQFSFAIDTKTEEQIFQSNMFKQAVFDLPLYQPVLQTTDIVLSGTTKISVAAIDVCMNINPTEFSEASHLISNVYKGIRGTTIAAFTFHLIIFFLVIIFIALYAKSNRKFDKYILKHDKTDVWVMYLIAFGAESIILKGFVTNFTLWRDSGCFPVGQPNALLTDYLTLLDEFIFPLHSFSISLLVVSLVCFCYLVCLAIKRC